MSAQTDRRYGKTEAIEYVRLLGLWSYPDPASQVHRRDPAEYKRLLENLIKVNSATRRDEVGRWEVAAARGELRGMK
jgi:hypothetical protein